MKLIVGLGNPGKKYERSRHNVGFRVLDELALEIFKSKSQNSNIKDQNEILKFKNSKKLRCYELRIEDIILAKPTTFMNSSGTAVAKLATFYKLPAESIWVIHDDLDIKLGEFKIQKGVGPQLHYGISSIEKALGTKDFWRVRIGVDNRLSKIKIFKFEFSRRMPGEKYVLQSFTADEREILNDIINKASEELLSKLK